MDAEIARDEHESSHAEFLKLCSDGSPEELQESSRRARFALEAHMVATQRLKNFVHNGTVPENL
jgi:hypothetical protein